jgi:DMSO/TMAO reductase YedYZ molybdopterin-dependent catalytic subunit
MGRKAAAGGGRPVTVQKTPYNAETPSGSLASGVTPTASFYVRNHFATPVLDEASWRLRVSGAVRSELDVSLRDIKTMGEERAVLATLECAGNSRKRMRPFPGGTPWGDGALGTTWWKGVSLSELLKAAGLKEGAREVLFRGADSGVEGGRKVAFERSLPIGEALSKDVLLAYEMDGRALPPDHGYPLRLVVPGWYGMASVKWLVEVVVLEEPFSGWFQASRYVYADAGGGRPTPVRRMRTRSVILDPGEGGRARRGKPCVVSGLAWSGVGRISRVEFRSSGGRWREAALGEDPGPYAWRRWSIVWVPRRRGGRALMSRAFDSSGGSQPLAHVWNLHGYGYNTVVKVNVRVT